MEELTAIIMRSELRACLLRHGCGGTVYFANEEESLFSCSVAVQHEPDKLQIVADMFTRMGYTCRLQDSRIAVSPDDNYMQEMATLHLPQKKAGMQCTVSERLCLHKSVPLTGSGRQLIIETLRLERFAASCINKPGSHQMQKMDVNIDRIRRRVAIGLRQGDSSGLFESGCFLYEIEWRTSGRDVGMTEKTSTETGCTGIFTPI